MANNSTPNEKLIALMSGMGFDQGFIKNALQDPAFMETIAATEARATARAPMSFPAGASTGLPNDADFEDRITTELKNAKAAYERDRTQPPITAPPTPRSLLLARFQRVETGRGAGHGEYKTRRTYVGMVPGFSNTQLADLRRISISEMMVRKRHEGKYLLCRIISQTRHMVAVDMAVEDPEGVCAMLAIYHYPCTLDAEETALDQVFSKGAILAIREPYYKFPSNGYDPMIRVDAASDIVFLEPTAPPANTVRWTSGIIWDAPTYPSTALQWKERGNNHFKKGEMFLAAVAFSEGLKVEPTNRLLLLNRAEIYLRLQWYNSAGHDAEAAIAMGLPSVDLKRKAVVRAVKAYYLSARWDEAVRLANEHRDIIEAAEFGRKAEQRLRERNAGTYDWFSHYKNAMKTTPPRLDIASYQGPVEVRVPEGGEGPRGMFVTRDVKAGELLVVSKPLASYFPEDAPVKEMLTSLNFITNIAGKRSDYALIDLVVQKVWDDPNLARVVDTLYAGDTIPAADYPPSHSASPPLIHPRSPSADIDIARIEAVCSMNVFKIERIKVSLTRIEVEDDNPFDSSAGLYELPSFCNHSCLPSANRCFFGDAMTIRAYRDLKVGEEVTLGYYGALGGAPGGHKKWGFTCQCPLCQADNADSAHGRATRDSILAKPFAETIPEAKRRLREIEQSYADTPERRRCGVKPALYSAYQRLGTVYCKVASSRPDDKSLARLSAEAFMDALEAAGMVITDRSVTGPVSQASKKGKEFPLPVDTSKPPAFPDQCVPVIIQLAGSFAAIHERHRAACWVRVGVWVEDHVSGGGKDLFKEIYKAMIWGLPI